MRYLNIKGLEEPVSEIILGTSWFELDFEKEIDELLNKYISVGGNLLDTGRFYGGGKSEKALKNWLQNSGLRNKILLTSKAGHHYVDENNVHHPEIKRVNPECITEDLEFSLNNLGVDHFDIFVLHRDDPEIPVSVLMDRLEKHRLEGKIKAYGVSNWSIERIEEALAYTQEKEYQGITVNSPAYSLATVKHPRWVGTVYADTDYARWHVQKGITLLAWASQASGFFADIHPKDETTPIEIVNTYFSDDNFERLRRCKILAQEKDVDSINIALSYVLSQEFDVGAIIGPRNVKELSSSLEVEEMALTNKEIRWLNLENDNLV